MRCCVRAGSGRRRCASSASASASCAASSTPHPRRPPGPLRAGADRPRAGLAPPGSGSLDWRRRRPRRGFERARVWSGLAGGRLRVFQPYFSPISFPTLPRPHARIMPGSGVDATMAPSGRSRCGGPSPAVEDHGGYERMTGRAGRTPPDEALATARRSPSSCAWWSIAGAGWCTERWWTPSSGRGADLDLAPADAYGAPGAAGARRRPREGRGDRRRTVGPYHQGR